MSHPAEPSPSGSPSPEKTGPDGAPGAEGPRPGWLFLVVILLTGAMLYSAAPGWLVAIPLVFAAAAIGLAVWLLRRAPRGMMRTWLVVVMVMAGVNLFMSLGNIALQPVLGPFRECVSSSVTLSGVNECQSEYQNAVERMTGAQLPR
ncbi:hypothetical protein [Falsarthrobacter nasiphocae]|uniref:Uncharacterized protein n=1 Tax=Falsarthrobacter nasiphocae TaxID=189863 RepID=A0AAE3YGR5_9MICC|nr:hypothetical protein [Falsarthrobacter nasiphocae]MDR6891701.1 hypothetical protein [Falsarthrobacter nasiphocae]